MRAYRNAISRRYGATVQQSPATVGRWIATPSGIKDEINASNAYIQSLGKDIKLALIDRFRADVAAGTVDNEIPHTEVDGTGGGEYHPAFLASWRRFLDEWYSFYHGHDAWYENMWGGTWDSVLDWRKRARQYQESFEALPAPHGEKLQASVAPLEDPPGWKLPKIPWTPIIVILAIVGAIIILPNVFRAFAARD